MKYLVDTNIVSELIKSDADERVLNYLEAIHSSVLFLSVVTIGEIEFGIEKVKNSKKKAGLRQWLYEELLISFQDRIIDIDSEVMIEWGKLSALSRSRGLTLPIMDSLIAATCLVGEYTLITRNTKDFENIPGLDLINPFEVRH